jgi:hypothetical protein
LADDELWEGPFEDEEEEKGVADEGRWESPLQDEDPAPDEIPQELLVSLDAPENEAEDDLEQGYHYNTQRGDGHTYDVGLALDQGLTYTPPTDPPIIPSADDREGAELAAGFGLSMEDSDPDVEILPAHVDNNDLDLEDDVYEAIRYNSETQNLTNVRVRAANGIVVLMGTVPDDQDIERLVDVLADLEGVQAVRSHLTGEEEEGEGE